MEVKLAITIVVTVLLDQQETLPALWEAEEIAEQVRHEAGPVKVVRENHPDGFEGFITDARVLERSLRK